MNITSAVKLAKRIRAGIEISEPPKYHICEGCAIRTERRVGTGIKMDCPVHFNPFEEGCIKHEKFMKLERQKIEYNKTRG